MSGPNASVSSYPAATKATSVCITSSLTMDPNTPHKTGHTPGPPMTPTTNLKVLVAAAAAERAIDREYQITTHKKSKVKRPSSGGDGGVEGVACEDEQPGRKNKSLSLLCQRFLTIVETDVGVGCEFSLETVAATLGTNRRRIYDIINVLESLEMIVKQSKNWYMWLGQDCLLVTLAKLKAMARDDSDFRSLYEFEGMDAPELSEGVESVMCEDGPVSRWDKSLGVLCQKFVMLFLITPSHEVTLECAGSLLMPDNYDSTSGGTQPTNKTKVRRLYDIANVLTTLNLIRKKTFLAPNHRKMPGYYWCGPSLEQIDVLPVTRKSDCPTSLFTAKSSLSGVALTRRPSFGKNRPFIHQYEVKGQSSKPSSAPATPVKVKETGFKRSISFGGGANPKRPAGSERIDTTAAATSKGAPKATDYFSEIREFEAEMMKHAHKYPHVAPLFREFVQRYTSTVETVFGGGRNIRPKPATPPFGKTTPILSATPIPPLSMDPFHRATNSMAPLLSSATTNQIAAPKTSIESQIQPTVTTPRMNSDPINKPAADEPPSLVGVTQTAKDLMLMMGNLLTKLTPDQLPSETPPVSLECPEMITTVGYSKRYEEEKQLQMSTTTTSLMKPAVSDLGSGPGISGIPGMEPGLKTSMAPMCIPLSSQVLSSLVSQKSIPVINERTGQPSVSIPNHISNFSNISQSALLAGQIVTCLQPNVDITATTLSNQIPISWLPQLSSLLLPTVANHTPIPNSNSPTIGTVKNGTTSQSQYNLQASKEKMVGTASNANNRVPLASVQKAQFMVPQCSRKEALKCTEDNHAQENAMPSPKRFKLSATGSQRQFPVKDSQPLAQLRRAN